MLITPLLFAAALAQNPPPSTDCAAAMTRGPSSVTAQVCQAEAELERSHASQKGSAQWHEHLQAAAAGYKRALGLPADDAVKLVIVERLLIIFDKGMLDDPQEMVTVFRQLLTLLPTEIDPLFRYARYQERQGSLDEAEETLLSARRLQPSEIEPFRMLAQFYARRASALHASAGTQQTVEETPAGQPDKDGVYQIGGGVEVPRRFGNAKYPPEAAAAGVDGAVVAEIIVNELGIVAGARVLKSNPLLDEAALAAVKEWRYDPTIVDGRAVPVKMTVTVNFSLKR
jgi:TonB family protein